MKNILKLFLFLSIIISFMACKGTGSNHVSIGNISFDYDNDIWNYIESSDESAPLEFQDEHNNILSFYVTKESTYQHPLEMIGLFETMRLDDNYTIYLEASEIDVNGETWYEYGYEYDDGTTNHKVYQRFYGKYYNAITISYNSNIEDFNSGYDEAIKLMGNVEVEESSNKNNEIKAQDFLVGEWDLKEDGYLVLSNDARYQWYKDDSKDENNYHYGTYGCDIENENLDFQEGEGIYLVLFPEEIISNAESMDSVAYKSDFLISFEDVESNKYQMVNMMSFKLYIMAKVD